MESEEKYTGSQTARRLRQMADTVPEQVAFVLLHLRQAGYEAYPVGGCVRDALMGRPVHDYDITTSALPEQTLSVFSGVPVVTDGLKHGTVTVIRHGYPVEITTYRVDGGYSDGRHPDTVRFSSTLAEDLSRRDFTVNAMAVSWPGGELVDLFGGIRDLAAGVIRCVGDPRTRFTEDALRIMRAFRFAAKLEFDIEPETLTAAAELSPRLELISAERKAAELRGMLETRDPCRALLMMERCGVCGRVLPGVTLTEELAERVSALPPDFELRLGALLRGGGRPGGAACTSLLRELKYSNSVVTGVSDIAGARMPADSLPGTVRRFAALHGDRSEKALLAAAACGEDTSEPLAVLERIRKNNDPLSVKDLSVNGRDVIASFPAGVLRGPAVGEIISRLLEDVLDHPEHNDRDYLLGQIARTAEQRK